MKASRATLEMLSRREWQAFVTLTFKRLPGPLVEQRMLFAWLRTVGRTSRTRNHALSYSWVVRREEGELFGRPHLHVLLGDLPCDYIARWVLRPSPAIGKYWEQFGGGMVRTRACSATGAAEYLSDSCGMDQYEMGKFRGEWVIFGKHALGLSVRNSAHQTGCYSQRAKAEAVEHQDTINSGETVLAWPET